MKKLIIHFFLILIGCTSEESVYWDNLDLIDGKYYLDNEIYSGRVFGHFNGKIINGLLDGYVKEKNLVTSTYLGITEISSESEVGLEGKYEQGKKDGWWKFYGLKTDELKSPDGIIRSKRTYLREEVFYEDNKPLKYKEYSKNIPDTTYYYEIEEGTCSEKLIEVQYYHEVLKYFDDIEETNFVSIPIKYNICLRSGPFKRYYKGVIDDEYQLYLYEEGMYQYEKDSIFVENYSYENGKRSSENGSYQFYYKSYENGPYKIFYKHDGSLEELGTYENGSKNGPYKIYYKSGELKEEGIYTDSYKKGPFYVYFKSGEIREQGIYGEYGLKRSKY